jgi:hypothetical protein
MMLPARVIQNSFIT